MSSQAKRASAPRVRIEDRVKIRRVPIERKEKLERAYSSEDIDLIERVHLAACREDFYTFRRYVTTTKFIEGWYQAEVAESLQQFFWDWKDGLCPVLVLEAPPQHGKSRQIIDFIAWAAGHDPDAVKAIYASYSDDLGLIANMTLQRIISSERYQKVFPFTQLGTVNSVTQTTRTLRNSYFLEFVERQGSFRNTTVNGQITGMGLTLGIIDDPMKGRKEAQSITIRNSTWSWFTDDFFTRFAENAAMLIIMTRWHVDDPVGRFKELYPHAKVLSYPALGRVVKGHWIADDGPNCVALFPELKSKGFILKRKDVLVATSFAALYQQNPSIVGGKMFPVEKFGLVRVVPATDIIKSVRYWDKAGTEGGTGAYTAGVLMHLLRNGRFLISDVITGHWGALAREQRIKQTAELDSEAYGFVEVWVEQEPGSGGKESAESTVRNLAGHKVYADRVTGAKEVRAEPYAAQVQAGNVDLLINIEWNKPFIGEHELFPNGKYKDQVDGAGGAFIKLTLSKSNYDSSMSWVHGNDEMKEAA